MAATSKYEVFSAAEAVNIAKAYMARQYERKRSGIPLGPKTGMPGLDDLLGGYLEPGIHLLLGRTGHGKSALAWQWTVGCGVPAVYLTTEIPANVLVVRHAALVTNTLSKKLRDCTIDKEMAFELVERSLPLMKHINVIAAVGKAVGIIDLAEAVEKAKDENGNALLVVDSLHKWAVRTYEKASNEYEALSKAFLDLLALADDAEVPILIIGEKSLAKTGENSAESGAGSRRLAYDPVTVLNLDAEVKNDMSWTQSPFASRIMNLLISKQRNGPSGISVPLHFYGAFYRFSEKSLDIKHDVGLAYRPQFGQTELEYMEARELLETAYMESDVATGTATITETDDDDVETY